MGKERMSQILRESERDGECQGQKRDGDRGGGGIVGGRGREGEEDDGEDVGGSLEGRRRGMKWDGRRGREGK